MPRAVLAVKTHFFPIQNLVGLIVDMDCVFCEVRIEYIYIYSLDGVLSKIRQLHVYGDCR